MREIESCVNISKQSLASLDFLNMQNISGDVF